MANGSGVCIYGGGAATTQSSPPANPTCTSPVVTGPQTILYKIVGYDSGGGLTASSSGAAATSSPAVFGPPPQRITSITASGGVVTANFASALNTSVTANMTIHIVGVTGAGVTWCGIWTLASAPTSSQVTFNVSGATGTGTVSASSTGRLSNTQPITAISRASTGVISATTAQNHHWQVGATVQFEGFDQPSGLNGYYKIATASGNSLTCNTGNIRVATGVPVAGVTTGTVWEYNLIACPALSGTTLGYYIYSDSPAPGGALTLIGKTLNQESHFIDYGPFYAGGFVAPGYVPTAPPAFTQNKLLSTTILSGGGTTSLVLAANAGTNVSGGTIVYDDSPALLTALAFGPVLLSPGSTETTSTPNTYLFNSPITLPANSRVSFAATAVINDTWNCRNSGISYLSVRTDLLDLEARCSDSLLIQIFTDSAIQCFSVVMGLI